MPDITIVKKPKNEKNLAEGDKLEPDTGRRTEVNPGDTVKFMRGPGVLALTIKFTDRSPFGAGKETVKYDTPLRVAVAVDADPTRNLYTYSCISDGLSSDDGGEMEVANPK